MVSYLTSLSDRGAQSTPNNWKFIVQRAYHFHTWHLTKNLYHWMDFFFKLALFFLLFEIRDHEIMIHTSWKVILCFLKKTYKTFTRTDRGTVNDKKMFIFLRYTRDWSFVIASVTTYIYCIDTCYTHDVESLWRVVNRRTCTWHVPNMFT